MNARQRDLFLWLWDHRRRIGASGAARRGALIGALGGLAFALVLGVGLFENPANGSVAELLRVARQGLSNLLLLGAIAVPVFAAFGLFMAGRVFGLNEAMYRGLIAGGASVPDRKPKLEPGDRWPAIVVAVSVAILTGLVALLYVAAG